MTYRILHIGAGFWSRFAHAPVLQRLAMDLGTVSLNAICDLDERKASDFCTLFGYHRAFTSIEKAIAETAPELIYCTVHPAATYDVVNRLLPLQIPLFLEKPPGISVEQACALAERAVLYGTLSYVAFNRRRIPAMQRMKAWLGKQNIRSARAEMLRIARLEPRFAIETGIHALDCMRYLLGEPCDMEVIKLPYRHTDAADSFVRLGFPSGVTAEVALMLDCGLHRESYWLYAEGAGCSTILGAGYSNPSCQPGEWRYSAGSVDIVEADPDPLIAGGFYDEHLDFLDAVQTGRKPDSNLEDAVLSMRLAEAVQNGFCGKLQCS